MSLLSFTHRGASHGLNVGHNTNDDSSQAVVELSDNNHPGDFDSNVLSMSVSLIYEAIVVKNAGSNAGGLAGDRAHAASHSISCAANDPK